MHKFLLGITVLGVAATVGAVVALKNNENLRNKADDAAEKAKDAADKAISKAKEAADSLAKTVKDLGKGSSVDTDVDDDNIEDAPEHENADCLSLDDLVSPEAKEYVSKLKAAFSSAEKAFSEAMKESTEGTKEFAEGTSNASPAGDADIDAVDDVPDETDEAQITVDESTEVDSESEAVVDESTEVDNESEAVVTPGITSEDVDEVPGFALSDDEDTD